MFKRGEKSNFKEDGSNIGGGNLLMWFIYMCF